MDKSFSIITSDFNDQIKTRFYPGDQIRYGVSVSEQRLRFIAVRGTVQFSGASSERLELQFTRGQMAAPTLYWDSRIPETALGSAAVSVLYITIPGGFGSSSLSFVVEAPPQLPQATYIGSILCIACHESLNRDLVAAYKNSGHHFALNRVNAAAPDYPSFTPGVSDPPATLTWNEILYVVGGYAWKANFVKPDGYLVTNGVDNIDAQYNLPSDFLKSPGEFVSYEPSQTIQKPFDCGSCHTSGYTLFGDQHIPPGLIGAWREEGVGCEACHGPGSNHVTNPTAISPPRNPVQACVSCHSYNNKNIVEAENGLILHQQQTEELGAGVKFFFKCVSCHNPHASAHYNDNTAVKSIIQECTTCHKNVTVGLGMQFLRCIDCHMPYAVNSGA